jgi:large subunit ribosomal protein L23
MKTPHSIIKRPLLTEKSTRLRETGGHDFAFGEGEEYAQKIAFEVALDANKIEIRQAIEKLFNVQVSDVHTQIVRGKEKRVGRYTGRRPRRKKAIVTLEAGQTIEFFEGV